MFVLATEGRIGLSPALLNSVAAAGGDPAGRHCGQWRIYRSRGLRPSDRCARLPLEPAKGVALSDRGSLADLVATQSRNDIAGADQRFGCLKIEAHITHGLRQDKPLINQRKPSVAMAVQWQCTGADSDVIAPTIRI